MACWQYVYSYTRAPPGKGHNDKPLSDHNLCYNVVIYTHTKACG